MADPEKFSAILQGKSLFPADLPCVSHTEISAACRQGAEACSIVAMAQVPVLRRHGKRQPRKNTGKSNYFNRISMNIPRRTLASGSGA
ncbi:hypothetical protein [Herminiimonas sp. CN]|uniref:hypothetical protein n=1 Tax=Herminiimonas sp. CN TaxID=1349818 RepID=UPI0009DD73CB|nr:hypothetical protein [Herminiimonas sp. CN]